jgi:hypothetical protein
MSQIGRPTDYTPDIKRKVEVYIQYHRTEGMTDKVPSIANMAIELGVSRDTLYEWAKKHEEFSDILDEVLTLQEDKLLNYGLNSKWNPTITKLMLSKHGYREGHDVTSDGEKVQNIVYLPAKPDDGVEAE